MWLAMVTGPSDIELVRRFNDGDRAAFRQIVLRYEDRVTSHRRLLAVIVRMGRGQALLDEFLGMLEYRLHARGVKHPQFSSAKTKPATT